MKTQLARTRIQRATLLLLLSTLNPQLSTCLAQGTAFTYQGRLNSSGAPANGNYDLQFTLFNVSQFGVRVGPALTNFNTAVSDGLFTATLNFGAGIFMGSNYWLEISVRTNGIGAFTTLAPRQPLTPTPYAVFAENVGSGGLTAGIYGNAVTFNNAANTFSGSFTGNGAAVTNVNAVTLGGLSSSNFWKLGGNAGSTAGVNFLGTTDNQALEFKVNGARALRLQPNTNGAPNLIGGSPGNFVAPNVSGALIAGGGTTNYQGLPGTNSVSADFGTISGGYQNTIGPGAFGSTIGGGRTNTIHTNTIYSTISGGYGNTVQTNADASTIGGGLNNMIQSFASYGTIGGGFNNIVSGLEGTVPGGRQNEAGSYSFAAGHRAKATHFGTFVWADFNEADFAATGPSQFLIRAGGGVGIGTTNPITRLTIGGAGVFNSIGAAAIILHNTTANHRWEWHAGDDGKMQLADFTASATRLLINTNGQIGIGIEPSFTLHVNGTAGKPGGGTWSDSSDARLKKNVHPLGGALDRLLALRGVSFEWVNPADHANQTGRQAGFVAQEVERVFPNWVQNVPGAEHDASLTPDGRVKSLSLPFEFDALTVEALRELRAENAGLKRELQELKEFVVVEQDNAALRSERNDKDAEIQDLKVRLSALEKLLANLNRKDN